MASMTRRRLLRTAAAGGAALLVPWDVVAFAGPPAGKTRSLRKFVDPLPVPATIDATTGAPLTIGAGESTSYSFHSQLGPARTWGYGGAPYLGPTIEARRGVPVTVTWENNLPGGTFIPNDPTLMGAVPPGAGPAPIVTHLHGGQNLPQYDGTPLQWYTRTGETGPHFLGNTFTYENDVPAAMVWYHDHALGNTRTNVYAGLAGAFFIRDDIDTGKPGNPLGLPVGPYEIPLVLQDKTFNPDGTLFYPDTGVTAYHPVWVPEFFGDTPVVNGKCYPYLDVEPRRYRLRVVNGSQSRFYNLKLVSVNGTAELPFTVIGSDGGLLRAPVPATRLVVAPGERYDLIVDFAGGAAAQWVLKNDAKAPYPSGRGGEVVQLMRFNVRLPLQGDDATTPPESLELPVLPFLPAPTNTRVQPLFERIDPATGNPISAHLEGPESPYLGPDGQPEVTTRPHAGAVEDWLLVNTTGDTHPIHLHLVTFEVVDRRRFDVARYQPGRGIPYVGGATPPLLVENGRKDTVQAHPGEVTRIRARFDLPAGTAQLPPGVSHPQYVWHCHILEHEENDMMRAFEVV